MAIWVKVTFPPWSASDVPDACMGAIGPDRVISKLVGRASCGVPFMTPATLTTRAMTHAIDDLIRLLALEPLERNIYRGLNRDIGSGRIFGGQVLAQSLVAARKTIVVIQPAFTPFQPV